MAAALRESPEESPEVPEADLSMEVQAQLRGCLAGHQCCCAKDETKIMRQEWPDDVGRTVSEIERAREKYSEIAIMEMVRILQTFDPDISKDKLSSEIHSILHADSVVGHLNSQFKGSLRKYVPRDRKEWLVEDIERHMAAKRSQLRKLKERLRRALTLIKAQGVTLASDPTACIVLLSGGGGAVIMGACGSVLGLSGGTATGALMGLAPAPLTFGLSVPIGAAVGGSVGACTGTVIGTTSGFFSGSIGGGLVYAYRVEIKDGVVYLKRLGVRSVVNTARAALDTATCVSVGAIDAADSARQHAVAGLRCAASGASSAGTAAVSTTRLAASKALEVAQDRAFQASAVSAVGGAAVVGTGGCVAGLTVGGAVGAACGVVPALFTFGLSIPVGAAVGSGAGFCIGVTAGSTAGFAGGGAAGYGAYTWRSEICAGVQKMKQRAMVSVGLGARARSPSPENGHADRSRPL